MHLAFPFYESNILIISFFRLEASRNEGRYISGCSVTLQTVIDIASFKYSVIVKQSIQEPGAGSSFCPQDGAKERKTQVCIQKFYNREHYGQDLKLQETRVAMSLAALSLSRQSLT